MRVRLHLSASLEPHHLFYSPGHTAEDLPGPRRKIKQLRFTEAAQELHVDDHVYLSHSADGKQGRVELSDLFTITD